MEESNFVCLHYSITDGEGKVVYVRKCLISLVEYCSRAIRQKSIDPGQLYVPPAIVLASLILHGCGHPSFYGQSVSTELKILGNNQSVI